MAFADALTRFCAVVSDVASLGHKQVRTVFPGEEIQRIGASAPA